MSIVRSCLLGVSALSLMAVAAHAQPAQKPAGDAKEWSVTIGAFGGYGPDYQGSDDYEFGGAPLIEVEYGPFFIGRQGIGAAIDLGHGFSFGLAAGFDGGRDQDDNAALRGLGDIDPTMLGTAFLSDESGGFGFGVTVQQDVLGDGHDGAVVTVDASYALMRSRELILTVSPSVTWASDSYMQSYFGIDAAQARRSGRAVYNAGSGFKDIGASLIAIRPLNDHWALTGIAGYTQLLSDAADSPIVDRDGSASQFNLLVGVSYKY